MFVSSAEATSFTYSNFTSSAGLTMVGAANNTSVPGQLELTPAATGQSGAAYSTSAFTLGAGDTFSTQFDFQLTQAGGIDPADGIVFVVAANTTGLGTGGGGMGYGGVTPSIGVELDTFNNGGNDLNSSNHAAIDIDGHIFDGSSLSDQAGVNVYGIQNCNFFGNSYLSPGCMANGDIWTALITYNGTSLSLVLTDPAKGASFAAITNYALDLSTILGTNQAFVGFTAGTGAGFERQNILNWTFADTATLPGGQVPEPCSLLLLGSGIVVGGIRRLRNRRLA
jgi:hypothetical protein